MQAFPWQIKNPIDAIMFDCDGTLSSVEGITVLAEFNHVFPAVHALTEQAMAETGLSADLYQQRLDLTKPELFQIQRVVDAYWQQLTPDTAEVIDCLLTLGKSVYVVSAGVQQAVTLFAAKLGISADHVFAVDVYFDQDGHYKDFDRSSPLTDQLGKSKIVEQLRVIHHKIAHIGDGMNDIEAAKVVDRFIGYGGAYYRESIAQLSPFYITSPSLAPALPLLLTENEAAALSGSAKILYQSGLQKIQQGQLIISPEVW